MECQMNEVAENSEKHTYEELTIFISPIILYYALPIQHFATIQNSISIYLYIQRKDIDKILFVFIYVDSLGIFYIQSQHYICI